MTASAGLQNMAVEMRVAVVAGASHVSVRADLGQIEPGCRRRSQGTGLWPGPRSTMTCTRQSLSLSTRTECPPGWTVSGRCATRLPATVRVLRRNALVQGAASELFKVTAVTVRTRDGGLGAEIVLRLT